jgi:hypothetical protein
MTQLTIFGVEGLPEITIGSELGSMIVDACIAMGKPLQDRDVVVVTSKVVSKAEGQVVRLEDVEVSPFARQYARVEASGAAGWAGAHHGDEAWVRVREQWRRSVEFGRPRAGGAAAE